MVAKRSAGSERTQTINQARSLILTGPDDLRTRFAQHTVAALVAETASLRPRPGDVVGYAVRVALRELGRSALSSSTASCSRARRAHHPSRHSACPWASRPLRDRPQHRGAAAHRGRGPPRTAPQRGRLGAPVRGRAHPRIIGQDRPPPPQPRRRHRQANHALWRIVFTRMGSHPATRAYVERRTAEGKSKAEIIRCLKRYVAREIYPPPPRRPLTPTCPGDGLTR